VPSPSDCDVRLRPKRIGVRARSTVGTALVVGGKAARACAASSGGCGFADDGYAMKYVRRVNVPLFLEEAARLRSSTAASMIDETAFRLYKAGPTTPMEVSVTIPDDEATTAFFARVRDFGTPGKLLYVVNYIDHLAATATGARARVIQHLQESAKDVGVVSHNWHRIVLGASATPRDVWELWAYGFILHTDLDKRARWESLDEVVQGMGKYVAYAYAGSLYHLVTVVETMLRDPDADDRHVTMQVLAPRPGMPVPAELAGFRAARVRLRE
jgi:hypothetical protein